MDLFRRQTKAPSKEAAAKGYFRAKATMDLETVTAKLAAVEAEIATAEGELSRVSLASVLSDDQATGFEAVTRLNELRTRREILRHALGAATAAEQERLASLRSKADLAQRRALAQHLAAMERHAVSLVAAQVAVRDIFRQLVNAADGARANLPKHLSGHIREGIEGQLSADSLRFLAECAAYGQSQGGIAAPGCTRAPPNAHTIDQFSGHWPGLIELVSSRVIRPVKNLVDPPAPTEIAAISSVAADAPTVPDSSQPAIEHGPAAAQTSTRSPALTGVVIRNGSMTNSTERMPAPEPYQETPGAPVDELIAPEETLTPAAFVAPPYTAAEIY
jgi:hypothetical protein